MNLNQVTVPVADVKKSIEFYKKLGLKLIVENLPTYARFVCPEGNTTFSLHLSEQAIMPGIIVYFECDNLVDKLKKAGIHFDSLPEDKPWLWREAYLKDLDGNIICLYYAGENRLNPVGNL